MLVSIVIPCYNSEHTIGKVVELAIEEFSKRKIMNVNLFL